MKLFKYNHSHKLLSPSNFSSVMLQKRNIYNKIYTDTNKIKNEKEICLFLFWEMFWFSFLSVSELNTRRFLLISFLFFPDVHQKVINCDGDYFDDFCGSTDDKECPSTKSTKTVYIRIKYSAKCYRWPDTNNCTIRKCAN